MGIYYVSYASEHFDESFNRLLNRPWIPFALYDGEAFVGMSCYLNIDDDRQTLEIGNTYYRPAHRGTGSNARAKDMMLRHAFDRGYRRVEFRVDSRNVPSQAMAKLGGPRGHDARGPDHLDRPCPRYGAIRDLEGCISVLTAASSRQSTQAHVQ